MLRKIKINFSQQKYFVQNDSFFQIFSAARNLKDCLMLFHGILSSAKTFVIHTALVKIKKYFMNTIK